jgi:enoyl-CoA hydratase/carnithine racemase
MSPAALPYVCRTPCLRRVLEALFLPGEFSIVAAGRQFGPPLFLLRRRPPIRGMDRRAALSEYCTPMPYSDYQCCRFRFDSGVAFVSIEHPPINLLDEVLSLELDRLGRELESDASVRVVVLQSALADFFIAHSGLGRVGSAPKTVSATRSFRLTQTIGERFRNMPKVTIAKVEGRARGGGSEIALATDMCFAALGKAIFSQPEVAVGLVPGGGSTQRLPRLIGRGRALEVLLGCNDLSAELAERYGYINRALPADELTAFVDKLAHRIASFPAHAIGHVKAAVDTGAFGSLAEGLLVEAHESDLSVASDVTQARVKEALQVGAETYEGELEMDYMSRLSPSR